MKHKIINLEQDVRIGIVGDIHEHQEQFENMIEEFQPSDKNILVSIGDILDKGFGAKVGFKILRKLKDMQESGISYTVPGNHDYKHLRKALRANKKLSSELKWIDSLPWAISFKYPNHKTVIALHGGVSPKHTIADLNSADIMYVKTVDKNGEMIPMKRKNINGKIVLGAARPGQSWHELYDGRFGYICSGHDAQKDGRIKYYKYSCNVDTACYQTGILSCQIFDQKGLVDTIQTYGVPFGG